MPAGNARANTPIATGCHWPRAANISLSSDRARKCRTNSNLGPRVSSNRRMTLVTSAIGLHLTKLSSPVLLGSLGCYDSKGPPVTRKSYRLELTFENAQLRIPATLQYG